MEECCCFVTDRQSMRSTCRECDAPMHAIDFDTGKMLVGFA